MQRSRLSREWIQREFEERRKKNSALSLRAFAKFLKVPASKLSEILSGKRPITSSMGMRVAERLGYAPEIRKEFLDLVAKDRAKRKNGNGYLESESPDYHQLSADAFYAISDWYHFAILSLMETKDFIPDPKWLGSRLNVSPIEIRSALERLERLGLIERKGKNWNKTHINLTTTNDIRSVALRRGHQQMLEKAIHSLDDVELELRDITSMTMAIDLKNLPQAKEMIRNFRRNLCSFLEKGQQTEVYGLSVQLIPLSGTKGKNHA